MNGDDAKELIKRRRRQILVHSCIYYKFDNNVISDFTYDEWSKELAELQRDYPEESEEVEYVEYFENLDGSTGFHLPHYLPNIITIAYRLVEDKRIRYISDKKKEAD